MPSIRFAEFTFDPHRPELRAGGRAIPVRREALRLLALLVRTPGGVVPRAAIEAQLSPGRPAAESAAALDAALERLRVALGDFRVPPRFIAASPDGLCFIGPIAPADEQGATPAAVPTGRAAPGRTGLAILGVCGLLVAAGAAFWLSRSVRATPTSAPTSVPTSMATRLVEFTALRGEVATPSFSPDAFRVAFAWNGHDARGGYDVFVKARGSAEVLRLTYEPAQAIGAAWSPDGSSIAFVRVAVTDEGADRSGLFVVPAVGGEERRLAGGPFARPPFLQPAWSPDGWHLAFAAIVKEEHVLRVLDLDRGMIATLPRVPGCREVGMPAYAADGERLAFACVTATGYSLVLTGPQAAEARVLVTMPGKPLGLAWHFDEQGLIVADDPGTGARLWHHDLRTGSARELSFGADGSSPTRRGGELAYVRARLTEPPGSDILLVTAAE